MRLTPFKQGRADGIIGMTTFSVETYVRNSKKFEGRQFNDYYHGYLQGLRRRVEMVKANANANQ